MNKAERIEAIDKIARIVDETQEDLNTVDILLGKEGYDSPEHHSIREEINVKLITVTGYWLEAISIHEQLNV